LPKDSHTLGACSTIGPAGLNLRRLEGVSARPLRAGAFCRNPERSLRRILTFAPRPVASLVQRHVDFRVAAGFSSIDRFLDQSNVRPQAWPLLYAENHDRDFAARKTLLIAHVLVGGQQYIEAVGFRGRKQLTILKRVPALLRCCADLVSFEIGANRYRRRLIE
jgi:hypothetical protein